MQAAIQRYLRKRARRPYVKAAREQDPARELQNKSRERPRENGKFKKARPDFVSITAVQSPNDGGRTVSAEVPVVPIVSNAAAAGGGGGGSDGGGCSGGGGAGGLGQKERPLNHAGAERSEGVKAEKELREEPRQQQKEKGNKKQKQKQKRDAPNSK